MGLVWPFDYKKKIIIIIIWVWIQLCTWHVVRFNEYNPITNKSLLNLWSMNSNIQAHHATISPMLTLLKYHTLQDHPRLESSPCPCPCDQNCPNPLPLAAVEVLKFCALSNHSVYNTYKGVRPNAQTKLLFLEHYNQSPCFFFSFFFFSFSVC